MKKVFIFIIALFSLKTFAYSASPILDYTLAELIYATALPIASSEVSTNATSTKAQKLEALQVQDEISQYFESNRIGLLLESKLNIINSFYVNNSTNENIDILIKSTEFILSK